MLLVISAQKCATDLACPSKLKHHTKKQILQQWNVMNSRSITIYKIKLQIIWRCLASRASYRYFNRDARIEKCSKLPVESYWWRYKNANCRDNVTVDIVLSYPNNPIPTVIFHDDDTMRKTCKADLAHLFGTGCIGKSNTSYIWYF